MRYVLAVADARNFTRAAEQCFVVQSALSQRIANLERELGVALFARTSRRVELTAAGQAFIPPARQCLEAADRAAAEAAAAVGQVRGRLTIGVIPNVAAVDLPDVLRRVREKYLAVRIELRVGASDWLAEQVVAGNLDVAFLGLPENQKPVGVSFRALASDRHVAVLPVDHHLAGRAEVGLADLSDEAFADFPYGSPGRAQGDYAFASAEIRRDVAYEVVSADLMLDLVRHGLAVALLPSMSVNPMPELAIVSVTDGPGRVEYLAWSDFNPSPATRAFLDILADEASPGTGHDVHRSALPAIRGSDPT
ncbi:MULTISPECIES: LysR family transcriptional regulator [unclassified Nocardioides]|uniref:LysR family transcriptional regulator n=1 Tax=unclassified Nocardioides TaxID=2615069 RepID=UPI0000EB6055|nr:MULTISPECIES: LysR family transcriptional regulator [unclassified Nocardioides]ABL80152.1 transcriptional regulator, LysR family [Nocardioides sp. JS614]